MEEKLRKVMAQVLNVPLEEITEDSSPDTIKSWDSLKQVNLNLALEQAFGVSFTADEIIEMLNYKLIVLTLNEKGIS